MKRFARIFAAAILAVSSLLAFGIPMAAYAASGSDTCAWTGGGTADNFNDAANWSGCSSAAPVDGDSLTFDQTSLTSDTNINNDLTNLQIKDITFSGTNGNNAIFKLQGNSFTLKGSITSADTDVNISNDIVLADGASSDHSVTAKQIYLTGVISGTGNLILDSTYGYADLSYSNSFVGDVTLNGGTYVNIDANNTYLGATSNHIFLNDESYISFNSYSDVTIANPITFNSTAVQSFSTTSGKTLTLSGNITLQKNVDIGLYGGGTAKLTGGLSGAYSVNVTKGASSKASLVVASSPNTSKTKNDTYKSARLTTTYKDSQTYGVYVSDNNTVLVDGVRDGDTTVVDNGILGGTGKIGNLTVYENGIVSPGHSPGCLTTKNEDWHAGSIYTVQLQGTKACSQYDQLKVTGTVKFNLTKLNLNLLDGYKAKAGDTFTIISNDGKDKIDGTFVNLNEGSTFAVDGYVFKISYKGGDGNDVVLTVQSIPGTPDTGFMLLKSNPAVTLLATTAAAGGLLLIARRTRKLATKR